MNNTKFFIVAILISIIINLVFYISNIEKQKNYVVKEINYGGRGGSILGADGEPGISDGTGIVGKGGKSGKIITIKDKDYEDRKCYNDGHDCNPFPNSATEIIGNIYENPELVEK